jgi:hypothetical protein
LSVASFDTFPFFVPHNWEPEGQWQRGRLFWVTFFGEAKKVTSCRATPDLLTDKQQKTSNQDSKNKAARVTPALQKPRQPKLNLNNQRLIR